MGIATAMETKVNTLLTVWVNGVSQRFMTDLIPLALIAFTVYLTLLGWQIMRGEAHDPIHTIVKRLLMLGVIGALALGALGYYQLYVINTTQWATQALIQEIANGGVNMTALGPNGNPINFGNNGQVITLGNLIDSIITTYQNLYLLLSNHFTSNLIPDFATIISAFFVAIALGFVVLISLGFYLLARVELCLCLAVGPVFILLACFEQTREWTKRWIGQLWHFVLQVALMAATISMLQGMLVFSAIQSTNNYQNNGGNSVFADVIALFLLSLAVCVILWNIGDLARALTGAVGSIGHSQVQNAASGSRLGRWMSSPGQPIVGTTNNQISRGSSSSASSERAGGSGWGSTVPAAQRAAMDNITGAESV
jgi:type IV secretion system protein VirB6